MCCGHESHHGGWQRGHHHGGFCACSGPFRSGPRFWTKEEKIAWLEQYFRGLQEEAKAVEERIVALKEEE
ncbi:MAG: hypothetical protein WBH57_05700 [Anaerolineae bacterium]